MKYAIETRGLSKSYGRVRAVESVDLHVGQGEIYGFLGLNGAGKTTTIRALLGMIRPTSGSVRVLGHAVGPNGNGPWQRVGHLVEEPAAYPELTVRENLEIARRLQGISDKSATSRAIERLSLASYADRKAGVLSAGNFLRLGLARAFLHEPELLILDEPANGLDPAGIIEIRALLRRLADQKGVTIFMSSHHLDEVEHLADRVGIVHAGSLVEEVDYGELREHGRFAIEIEVDDVARAERILRDELGFVGLSRSGEASLRITDRTAKPAPIARALIGAGIALERLVPMEEDLERHFMRLTGGES